MGALREWRAQGHKTMVELIGIFGYVGVFAFAASGALAAGRQGMDIFGFIFVGLLPAVGGGTVRDLLLNLQPFWIHDQLNVTLAFVAAVSVFAFGNRIKPGRLLAWCDCVGLSVFSVLGAQTALAITDSVLVAIMLGVTTAVVGGIMRDVVCNEVPLVLHKEIYATAAFAGSGAYCLLATLEVDAAVGIPLSILICFAIRGIAMVTEASLPSRSIHN